MKTLILLLALLPSAFSLAQSPPLPSVVKAQALSMGKALVAGDGNTFSRYMLPEMIEAGGGPEKLRSLMDSMFMMFRNFGGNVDRITYGNPGKIVRYGKELQTTVPQTTSITSPLADLDLATTLVAISRDDGKNWFFYDPQMGQARQMKDKLPRLSPEIVIPPAAKPRIVMKQELPRAKGEKENR